MSAIIYTRFSPRPDAANSESCDVQRRLCEEFAARKGWEVSAVFDDPDRSGADEFREVLWSAIGSITPGDVLLVYKRDRIARNVYLSEQVNRAVSKRGGRIVAVSGDVDGDGPEQVLIRQVVAAMAEYERKLISIRTSASMLAHQRSGRRVGGDVPYGYAVDPSDAKRIVESPAEKQTISKIIKLHGEGQGPAKIAAQLDPSTARSGRWHPEQVRRIIERERREGRE